MPDGSNHYDVIGEFRDAFVDAGLVAPAEIIADGQYHRCDVIGKRPRNRAGRYKLYLDQWPAGVLQNFVESSLEIWHPKRPEHKPSAHERAERKRYYEEKRVEAEADLASEQARVAITAEWRWSGLVEAVETPYTFRKHIGAHGARKAPYGTDLYVSARDVEGKLWCLQEIRADGKKLFPRNARVKGCFHVIGEVADGWPLQIAEGFATGASAFEANGIATVIAFYSGNLLHVTKGLRERYPNSPITILADDDAETERRIGKNPGIEAAVEAAIAVGGKMAVPQFGADRAERSDFNDVHVSAGLDAVREQIATARDPVERAYPAPAEPLTVEQARAQLDRILNGFMRIAPTWSQTWPRTEEGYLDLNKDAPAYCISMPPGLGKTTGILERVVPAALKAGKIILIAVPRHKLGKQLVDDLAALGVTARVYQSRGAADLEKPGQPMCPEIERVEAIQGALGEVSRLACKSANGICDKFETCGYQRQQRPPEPQVWVIPHQNLFFALPSFIPKPDIVVIDEGFVGACFEKDVVVEFKDLASNRDWPKGRKVEDEADLRAFSLKVYEILIRKISEQARCRMRRDWFEGVITAEQAKDAHSLEWKRKLEIDDVHPGMPVEQAVERARRRADHNQLVKRLCAFWAKLALTLEQQFERSLYLQLDRDCTIPFTDKTAPAAVVSSRMKLSDDITRCPAIHCDAYLNPMIVQQFFPGLVLHQLSAAMPVLTTFAIEQETDRVISKSSNSDKIVEEVRQLIEREAAATSGRVGVICLKHIETGLRKEGRPLPRKVTLAHYGNITGMNDLADVSTLALIGRPEPAPMSVEQQARLLFEREVVEVARYYPKRKRGLAVRGSADVVIADGYYHPDLGVESLRWSACEGELMQALHRARPINRTAANPLRVVVATNVALPIEVDLVTTWAALQPTLFELMLARFGAALFSPTDMTIAFPDLFPTAEAAKKSLHRERENWGQIPYRVFLKRIVPSFPQAWILFRPAGCYRELSLVYEARYRRVGARGPTQPPMAFDPNRISDPLAWLRSRLRCEVVLVHDAAT